MMKRLIIFIILIVLFSNLVFADEFSLTGMKLELNYSKFIGDDTPGNKVSNIPGFAIGGFLTYKINTAFVIQRFIWKLYPYYFYFSLTLRYFFTLRFCHLAKFFACDKFSLTSGKSGSISRHFSQTRMTACISFNCQ